MFPGKVNIIVYGDSTLCAHSINAGKPFNEKRGKTWYHAWI